MNDVLPAETPLWQHLEGAMRDILIAYGYEEIRVPAVEHTELFKRAIGEFTDVVEKEMYTFTDQGGDSLTLRPEITAGAVSRLSLRCEDGRPPGSLGGPIRRSTPSANRTAAQLKNRAGRKSASSGRCCPRTTSSATHAPRKGDIVTPLWVIAR